MRINLNYENTTIGYENNFSRIIHENAYYFEE